MASRLRQLRPILQRCAARVQEASNPNRPFSTHSDCIQVTPKVSLFDQKVHVKVQGLPSRAKVTLQAVTQQEWRRKPAVFRSCGHFLTSEAGDLDLQRDASVGGSYTGVDPMGPFWSLQPCPSGPQNIRMVLKNMDQPVLYDLSLHLGHWSLGDLVAKETTLTPVCSTVVTRLKMAPDVRRIPVKEGNVRGMLFLPAGEGPHPAVVDMFGTSGGLMEMRAALLASHGLAVLALPYFNYQDLPKALPQVVFDYFEEAVSWLCDHPAVKRGGVGVVGTSKGGELALLMAWKCPQVKVAVVINGVPSYMECDLYRRDGSLVWTAYKVPDHFWETTEKGVRGRKGHHIPSHFFMPVWENTTRLLIVTCEDDGLAEARFMTELLDLYPRHRRHLVELLQYPGAGHLLEPPYTPHCQTCYSPGLGTDLVWGGNPADHTAAQEDSWKRILHFLHTNLGHPVAQSRL